MNVSPVDRLMSGVLRPGIASSDVSWIDAYRATEECQRALSRLHEEAHDEETVNSLSGSGKYVMAGTMGDWGSVVIKTAPEYRPFSVLPGAAITHVVECASSLTLRWAHVEGITTLKDIPVGARLGAIQSLELVAGQTFVIPEGLFAVQLGTLGDQATLLRFNGPPRNDIDLSFDEASGAVRSVSFNNPKSSSQYFFAMLVGEMAKAPAVFQSDEADALAAMFLAGAQDDIHMYAQWTMVQALGRIHPSTGVKLLERIAASSLPNANASAVRALARLRC